MPPPRLQSPYWTAPTPSDGGQADTTNHSDRDDDPPPAAPAANNNRNQGKSLGTKLGALHTPRSDSAYLKQKH